MIEDFENFIQVDESFLVVLDSRNATEENSTYGYNSDLTFKLQTPIIQPVNAINLKANILNFTCPNSQFVVNETNNILGISFDTTGTPYTNTGYTSQYINYYVQLNVGNYNAYTFQNEFLNELNLLGIAYGSLGNFVFEYDTLTNRYALVNSDFYFYIFQNIIFTNSNFNQVFPTDALYRIGDVIGFDNTKKYSSSLTYDSITSTYVLPYRIQFPFPANFSGLQNLNIHIDNIKTYNVPYQAKNLILSKNNFQEYQNYSKGNLACSVPVNCKPMEIIFYEKMGQFAFTVKDEQLDTIRISLRDDLGNLLQLNGQNWNLTLEFILTKHIEKKTRNFYSILSNPYPRFE